MARPDAVPDKAHWKIRLIVALGGALLRLLALTWRKRLVNADAYLALVKGGQPVIFAFWHGDMLPLLFSHFGQRVSLLISEHRDGEIIARIGESLGYGSVRGSTTRGAGRALLGLIRELETGSSIAVTPDGPRGPARTFAPGALVAAQRAGAPIVPVGAWASSAWRLRSWDRFMVPKPFARVVVAYAEPTWVEGDGAREAAAQVERFAALQRAAVARAYAAAGEPAPDE
jgi:hypothetical protein